MNDIFLCAMDEVPYCGSKGFEIAAHTIGDVRSVFIVHHNNHQFYGYVNSCPHTGVALEWMPDQFLSADLQLIVCATHGAQFEIHTGRCVSGPCLGQSLQAITLIKKDQDLYWRCLS